MLSVSLGFWVQKNYLNRESTLSPENRTSKMEKPGKHDAAPDSQDKYKFVTDNKSHKLSGVNFVIILSIFFMSFYVMAMYWSFKAYKEFKGNVEDHMGGPSEFRK